MSDGLFSATQVEYLAAMGYSVLALQSQEDAPVEAAAPEVIVPAAAVTTVTNVTFVTPPAAAKPPTSAPVAVSQPAEVVEARAAAVRATASSSPLERALLSATGQTRRADARAVLDQLNVDIEALRNDPAAKRALWRRLRAIRAKRR